MDRDNYSPLLAILQVDVLKWSQLHLSMWGRVQVVKMNISPRFNYLFNMIPLQYPKGLLKELHKIIMDFVWDGKRPRLKRSKPHAHTG